jgi:hypothetical protein
MIMGRRQGAKNRSSTAAQASRRRLSTEFQELAARAGVNLLELISQQHEEAAVHFMVAVMQDFNQPMPIRMEAAQQIAIWARGAPKPWYHDGATIDPVAANAVIAEDKRLEAIQHRMQDLHDQGVPVSRWPADLRTVIDPIIARLEAEKHL